MSDFSYDACGPLVPLGMQKFSFSADNPPEFEVECFYHLESRSSLDLRYNGKHLTMFGIARDEHGFGTSFRTLFESDICIRTIRHLEGLNADLSITASLNFRPCRLSSERPYNDGAQSVFTIPYNWHVLGSIDTNKQMEFEVWKNGERMPGANLFFKEVERLISIDAAPNRKDGFTDRGSVYRENFGDEINRNEENPNP